jgi:hypothetical protein
MKEDLRRRVEAAVKAEVPVQKRWTIAGNPAVKNKDRSPKPEAPRMTVLFDKLGMGVRRTMDMVVTVERTGRM